MGRCPFGFTGEEEEEDEQLQQNGETVHAEGPTGGEQDGAAGVKKKDKKKEKIKVPDPKDPASMFFANQIKSEAEFQAKKDVQRADTRKRLEQIMARKNKQLVWPEDESEVDDMSVSSGELSELDSDVHSLASVRTCAYSWIEKKSYKMPAETATCWVASGTLALSVVTMALAANAAVTIRPVQAAVRNASWSEYLFLSALAVAGSAGCMLLASSWRSRKVLLAAHLCTLLAYGASVMLVVAISYLPTEVDTKVYKGLCKAHSSSSSSLSSSIPSCNKLTSVQSTVTKATEWFWPLVMSQSVACLVLGAAGAWYLFELCYVEKKGAKHMRRHRRNKFTIPWDKIKIVGKPLPCGGGGGGAAPAGKGHGAGGGKCPVGFGG